MNRFDERMFARSQKRVYKNISKTVLWNGQEFESCRALERHLRLGNPGRVSKAIKHKKPLSGHIPVFKSNLSGTAETSKN